MTSGGWRSHRTTIKRASPWPVSVPPCRIEITIPAPLHARRSVGRISNRPTSRGGIQFDAEPIVYGAPELLFASQVPLRRLDRYVAQEKLDLLEFATRQVTQSRTGAAQVVRRQF